MLLTPFFSSYQAVSFLSLKEKCTFWQFHPTAFPKEMNFFPLPPPLSSLSFTLRHFFRFFLVDSSNIQFLPPFFLLCSDAVPLPFFFLRAFFSCFCGRPVLRCLLFHWEMVFSLLPFSMHKPFWFPLPCWLPGPPHQIRKRTCVVRWPSFSWLL